MSNDLPNIEVLAEGRYLRLLRDGRWEYAARTNSFGAAVIVAVTDAGELVLVEQHRPAMGGRCIGLPAGLAGDIVGEEDEAMIRAARRELLEETGYEAATLLELASTAPSPGMCDETQTFFLARGLNRVGAGGGDSTEDIEVHRVPLGSVPAWLATRCADGAFVATNVYAGLFFARASDV